MRRAWNFRRFWLPLAGVVCCAGLSVGAELLSPPKPPPDVERLNSGALARPAPRPVIIEPIGDEPIVLEPAQLEYADLQPVAVQPPDPQPIIEPPLAVYPEALPPPVYGGTCGNSGQSDMLYSTTPGCDAGCGSSCGCLCLPTWTIRAEAIIWDRTGGMNVPLVNAPVLLGSGDLDFGWRAGPRLTAIRHGVFQSCWDVEVSYFGINGWTGTQTIADADNFLTTPAIAIGGATPLTATYTASLHNFEINARRMYSDWATWFIGFRTLQIGETLATNIGNGIATHSVSTGNQLYGAQLGLDVRLLERDWWYVNAVGKAGIYSNSADQVTRTAGVGGARPFTTFAGTDTSFVGELGFNAGYRMTDRLTLLAGYNLLWVSGVALAPNQLAATNITTGVGALDTNGNLFYHGVNMGAQYAW